MKFKKEDLQNIVWEDHDGTKFELIRDEIIDNTRWSIVHGMVFKFDGKFYSTSYSVGATESQDEGPFEYDPDQIECAEVEPIEVTVIEYRKKPTEKDILDLIFG